MQLLSVHSLKQIITSGNNYQYLTISISLVYSSHHSVPISSGLPEQTVSSWLVPLKTIKFLLKGKTCFHHLSCSAAQQSSPFRNRKVGAQTWSFILNFLMQRDWWKRSLVLWGLWFYFFLLFFELKLGSPHNGYCYGLQPELEELSVGFNLLKGRGGQKSPFSMKCKHFSFRLLAFFFCETCRAKGAIWRKMSAPCECLVC